MSALSRHIRQARRNYAALNRQLMYEAVQNDQLGLELSRANDLLRSMWSIAERDGRETNWDAFRKKLHTALDRQHAMGIQPPIIDKRELKKAKRG